MHSEVSLMLTKCKSSAITYLITNMYMVFIRSKKVAVIAEYGLCLYFPSNTKEHAYQHEIPQSILMFD